MGWASFKDICQEELRLDPARHQKLKVAVRNFMTEWDKKYDELWSRDGHRAYDPETLHQIAATYVQEGLYTATTKISPGKNLWTSSSITSDKPEYIYPRDKKAIVEGVEKVVAKIQQGQERYQNFQQRASVRGGKRKRDEESQQDYIERDDEESEQDYIEKDDDLELPDIDDLRKGMTPQSLPKPRRQSDRIKQNTYPTLNFNIDEDFLRSPTATQAHADEARMDEDHVRRFVPRKASDGHESSASEGNEQQMRPSKRLLWPSVGASGTRQIALTHPMKSLQKATTLAKASPTQPMDITRFLRPKMETADRDVILPNKTEHTMQSPVPKSYRRPSYQSESDSVSVDLQPLESITGASAQSEASEPTKSASKLRTPLKGSKGKAPAKKPSLNVASGAASTEQKLTIDLTDKKKASPSKGLFSSRDPVAVMTDSRSPTLAAQPQPQGLANQLRPNRTDPQRSSVNSSPGVDRLSMREESPSIEETAKVTRLSENHQYRVLDQPVQVVRLGRSTHFWILKNRPRQAWVLWRGADLVKENLQSVFAAVRKHTDCTSFHSLEIKLETPEQSFTFPMSEEDSDHFEDMKRFMTNMIETSCRERHDSSTPPRIWISPIEMNQC